MKRIDVPLAEVRFAIRDFYKADQHHFIAMNGLELGSDQVEVQWFFSDYACGNNVTMFAAKAALSDTVPTLEDIVASVWPAEREFLDLFGMKVEGRTSGFMLEKDSLESPLRRIK